MKLKTEMQDGCVHALGGPLVLCDICPLEAEILQHDAAAAHALMQAISEQLGSDERGPLLDRADELMREWGFES